MREGLAQVWGEIEAPSGDLAGRSPPSFDAIAGVLLAVDHSARRHLLIPAKEDSPAYRSPRFAE